MNYWKQILIDELELRRSKNHSYSLRAFAHSLTLSPAQLSQLLSGKRILTRKMAEKISTKLGLPKSEMEKFLYSSFDIQNEDEAPSFQIAHDEFLLISDWYHFGILSLSETKNSKASSLWISKRLGISHEQAAEGIQRLLRLGIIEIKNGKIYQIKKNLKTTTDIPSSAVRKYHRQNLVKASEKLEEIDVNSREFTSITMAIDTKNIPAAKKLITEFKRKLSSLLEEGSAKEVYTFSAQLFPVSILEDKK